ncbi:hypothetical protein QP162_14465 [Sphingomonas aurantiaca]|uniref:hypothetical protein n=1 Tax=Sphingomonas aurantiaca TaxID=185949 RepID=UPI002FDF6518
MPLLLLTAAAPAKDAAPAPAFFEALRAADLRLATIAYRLTTANAPLCDVLQPQIGMPIHALTQYAPPARESAAAVFEFESLIGVEAVVAGAPAQRAGIAANDLLVAIGDVALPGSPPANAPENAASRDSAEAAIAAALLRQPLRLTVLRKGQRQSIAVTPVTGCRSRFEILLGSGLDASADGSVVQIGERFFEGYTDAEIAVVVSHELAHNILRHRARLDAAKINRGLLAEPRAQRPADPRDRGPGRSARNLSAGECRVRPDVCPELLAEQGRRGRWRTLPQPDARLVKGARRDARGGRAIDRGQPGEADHPGCRCDPDRAAALITGRG